MLLQIRVDMEYSFQIIGSLHFRAQVPSLGGSFPTCSCMPHAFRAPAATRSMTRQILALVPDLFFACLEAPLWDVIVSPCIDVASGRWQDYTE